MKAKSFSRILCAALCLMLLLVCSLPALAATDSMANFSRVKTYSAGQYTDEASFDWAYNAIKTCYETSLMQGSGGSFKPKDNLTVAEALVMADRVHQIYHTGANTLTNGDPWYQPYIDYAIANGIINAGDFSDYTAYISRADMAYIFSRALPVRELGKLNDIGEIPDLASAPSRDQNAILLLYYAGVLTGSDSYGTFYPNNNITRAEAAAIISRVAIPAERRTITLLYKVQDGPVTFGIPQTGFLMSETADNGFTYYFAEGSGIISFLTIVVDPESGSLDITKQLTPASLKEIAEENGNTNVSVSTAAFGSINAYCVRGVTVSNGMTIENCQYMFFYKEGLYTVNVSWSKDADYAEAQTIINNIYVNGYAASPAYVMK